MMKAIAIDGACRRNGKPDCVSAGGVFILTYEGEAVVDYLSLHVSEEASTNQRGELLALKTALQYLQSSKTPAQIITDSEYLFNAMSKGWPDKWSHNGWVTASGDDVKNADIWQQIVDIYSMLEAEVIFYHIKGHVIPFGKVTAARLLASWDGDRKLYEQVVEKVEALRVLKATNFEHAQELSERNNGFKLSEESLIRFIAMNVVADAVATEAVEDADRNI